MIPESIAVLGAGRAGLGVARAAKHLGIDCVVLDEKFVSQQESDPDLDVRANWAGRVSEIGADCLVVSPGVPGSNVTLREALDDGLSVLSEVEFAYRVARAPIVAITGTNGKSTTTTMTWSALRACGLDAVLCGNIAGSGFPERTISEAAAETPNEGVLVAEMSSFQLEWVQEFRPVVGVLTNLASDHLDRYPSVDEYQEAKLRLFAHQSSDDFAIASSEIAVPGSSRRLTFGNRGTHAWIEGSQIHILGTEVDTKGVMVIGHHNYLNLATSGLACAAFLATQGQGLELPPAGLEALLAFPGLTHRMEIVGSARGIKLINNSMCTNPAAVVASASSLEARTHLLIGGKDKKLDFSPVRKYLAISQNQAYLFGQDANAIASQLGGNFPQFVSMQDAFDAAITAARPGEVVMLAPGCASMDQFEDFRHRGDVFKLMAKEWLNDTGKDEAG